MKRLYLLPLLLLLLSLPSCKDDTDDPAPVQEPEVPVSEPEVKEVNFDFRYDPLPKGTENIELIVSQKDSVVLLDTLISARTNHKLMVKSADTKFDVTTILADPATDTYTMRTYVQVNLDKWHIVEGLSYLVRSKAEPATIYYTNLPDYSNLPKGRWTFTGEQTFEWGAQYSSGEMTLHYERLLPRDMAYMMIERIGKYTLTEVTSAETYVDFSKAKPTATQKHVAPEGATRFSSTIFGYPKAGDYNKLMVLQITSTPTEHKLQFPPTGIEEFELRQFYVSSDGYSHIYSTVVSSIPAEADYFLPASDFTLVKTDFNDFQISFGQDKPSTYTTEWFYESTNLNVNWQIFLSPEETAFNPQGFLERLSPASLKDKDLSGLSLKQVISRTADNYDHQSMHDYLNNPEAFLKIEQRRYRQIIKHLK